MKSTWRFDDTELGYLQEVLASSFISSTSGNMNQRFEKAFAEMFEIDYAISFNSGTSTMHACLGAAGIGPGDEVIVPALTVISTASVVLHQNAVPIFADIDKDTFNIDPEDVKAKITPRTKAIIPVALYGLSADMDPLMKLARQHDLVVIEDAAQAHLSRYKGRMVGSMGHMGSFSFENSKHMTTGDGGMVSTSSIELATAVRKFGCLGYAGLKPGDGRIRKLRKDELQDPDYKRHDDFGWNYRMPEVAAAVGLGQLSKVERFTENRIKIAEMYKQVIESTGCGCLTPQYTPLDYRNSYYTFAARYDGMDQGVDWRDFRKKYIEFGGEGIYAAWALVYREPVFTEHRFYGKGCPHNCPLYEGPKIDYNEVHCPTAEYLQPRLMQFPNNYESIEVAEPMVEALEKTIRHFGM